LFGLRGFGRGEQVARVRLRLRRAQVLGPRHCQFLLVGAMIDALAEEPVAKAVAGRL
jgi:hypothetical protein